MATAQKKKKTVPWLCSSRSDWHTIQYSVHAKRRQPKLCGICKYHVNIMWKQGEIVGGVKQRSPTE